MKRGIHKRTCACFVCRFEKEGPRRERKVTRAVRLSPEDNAALLKAAKKSDLTVSQALASLINEGLQRHGYLPEDDQ